MAGRIGTLADRFERQFTPEPNSGCWLWLGTVKQIRSPRPVIADENGKIAKAHHVSWRLYRGEIPLGAVIRHRCDNTYCVNPDHLVSGTQADNVQDCIDRGRRARLVGNAHPNNKLNAETVSVIKQSPLSGPELGALLGLSRSTISKVRRGISGRYI